MAETEGRSDRALLIRDDEGNYYFLRPEFLEACKVPKEEVEGVKTVGRHTGWSPPVNDDVKPREAEVIGSLRVTRPLEDMDKELADRLRASTASTTYMCAW
jgi:hypothetical protein